MRALLWVALSLWSLPAWASELHAPYDELLERYVHEDRVDYNGWWAHKQSLAQLKEYVVSLEAVDPSTLPRDAEMAYWINLYNATTLRLVLDHYPVESIKDIGGFLRSPWKKDLVTVGGSDLTLDTIENDILRPRFQDPRIHFVLNCAAVDCPPLAPFAFTGPGLDDQLERVTRDAMRDPRFAELRDGKLHLTKLYDWYGDDWEDIRAFVARYRPEDRAAILDEDTELEYNDYDWKLNALAPPPK